MNGKSLSIRIEAGLYDDLTATCAKSGISRSQYVEQLIFNELRKPKDSRKSAAEAAASAESGAKLDSLLDKGIIAAIQDKGVDKVLGSLDDKTLAQLAVSRAPKPRDGDKEIEDGLLSLTTCLKHLPDVPELNRLLAAKEQRLEELRAEMDMMRVELLYFKDKAKSNIVDEDWWVKFHAAMDKFADDCKRAAEHGQARGVEVAELRALILAPEKKKE
jgi:hypothetical protein